MLLTKIEEIEACLPTSKWDDVDSLLAIVEEEEEAHVVPILGRKLYEHLVVRYGDLLTELGDISATNAELTTEDVTDEVRVIRLCQKVQLYMALANNAGMLTVSFNAGGGLNVASAGSYDAADKEQVARFVRDAWGKAHRNIDALLTLLERDAQKKEPEFVEMWRESRYFYHQGSLLITTAVKMQEYIDIKESRERFIELLPDLKYAQSVYIETELGGTLMDAFVRCASDNSIIPTYNPAEGEEITEAELLARNGEIRGTWVEALDRLRTALAHYAVNENEKMRRDNSLTNAEMSRARALAFIREHQEAFRPYIESSPLYVKPTVAAPEKPRDEREGYRAKAVFTLPYNLHRK